MKLTSLITQLNDLDASLKKHVSHSANVGLTIRNWLVGAYLVEYEQNGEDRAEYGGKLLSEIAKSVKVPGLNRVTLQACRLLYIDYPEICQTPSDIFHIELAEKKLEIENNTQKSIIQKSQTASDILETKIEKPDFALPDTHLLNKLSFSHFIELLRITNPLQRTFYEIESIRGNWSVRELKRQIGSLLYERTGLSTDKDKLIRIANEDSEQLKPEDIIRDPYIFEFLGLKPKEALKESDLEAQLLNDLQSFLLELGHGFCFEDRQKKIRIGSSDYFIDLVFYHRKLHCNVLIELKVGSFDHTNAGQLNTYLNYYKKHEVQQGDNPPIGLLLCTDKDSTLVEYALGGMDENMFVSSYKVALPDESELQAFLKKEARFLSTK
jgi:predicted nuclease of restriction endonuclease-like (RecB) superfamily